MSILPIAESKNWGLILVPMKRRPFCVMSKIGHNSPANKKDRMTMKPINAGFDIHKTKLLRKFASTNFHGSETNCECGENLSHMKINTPMVNALLKSSFTII